MTLLATTIITGDILAKLLIGAFAAGLGVALAFSLLIYCADRAGAFRREGRSAAAAACQVASAMALAACLAIVAYGLLLIASKPS